MEFVLALMGIVQEGIRFVREPILLVVEPTKTAPMCFRVRILVLDAGVDAVAQNTLTALFHILCSKSRYGRRFM